MKMDPGTKPFMEALQNRFPAKLKTTYIINAPWYMKMLMNTGRLFLKKKVMERVRTGCKALHRH